MAHSKTIQSRGAQAIQIIRDVLKPDVSEPSVSVNVWGPTLAARHETTLVGIIRFVEGCNVLPDEKERVLELLDKNGSKFWGSVSIA